MPTETAILDAVRQLCEMGSDPISQTRDGVRPREEKIVLAVSGGLDSMSLLDAASRVLVADRIVVATFDHGTGPAARDAASLVRAHAAELGVICESGRATRTLRSEAELRDARWAFLRHVAIRSQGVIATAHTADDQVETVLMRVLRGAGARGLAGLRAPGGPLRPFLDISRAQLQDYAHSRDLEWVEDPSNDSPAFFRNRVRHDLLPALRMVRPTLPDELLRAGEAAARWRGQMDSLVREFVPVRASSARGTFEVPLSRLSGLSRPELSVLWPSVAAGFGLTLDRRGIARLAEFTIDGRAGSRIQLSGGWSVQRARDGLTFSASSHVVPAPATIDVNAPTMWGAWSFRPSSTPDGATQWSQRLPSDATLTVRAWQPGDRTRSTGGSSRKVKELLSRAGVTGHKRAGWPVVLAGDEIVWIPGVWGDLGGRGGGGGSNVTERLGTAGVTFVCEYIDR